MTRGGCAIRLRQGFGRRALRFGGHGGGGTAHQTCHSAKRTHRFGGRDSMYHAHGKLVMPFAEGFCRWVRFGKRTHREGVFGGSDTEKRSREPQIARWNVCSNRGQHGDRAPWLRGERFGSRGWEERGRKTCVSAKRMHLEGVFGVRIGLLWIGKGEEMAL